MLTLNQIGLLMFVIVAAVIGVVVWGYILFMRWGAREAEKARQFREQHLDDKGPLA